LEYRINTTPGGVLPSVAEVRWYIGEEIEGFQFILAMVVVDIRISSPYHS
jgi:hypothetical protein